MRNNSKSQFPSSFFERRMKLVWSRVEGRDEGDDMFYRVELFRLKSCIRKDGEVLKEGGSCVAW